MSDQDRRAALAKRAMESAPVPQRRFGQVRFVDLRTIKWDSNAFIETDDDDPEGQLEIGIGIECFKKDGGTYLAEKKVIDSARGTNNWREITLASLKALRANVLDLVDENGQNGKWVEVEERMTKKWDQATKTVIETNFSIFYFKTIFPDQESCEASYVASIGARQPVERDESAQITNGSGNHAIEDAVKMLFTISGKDHDKFLKEVGRNTHFMSHFKTADAALEFVLNEEAEAEKPSIPF